jgi:diguanylate cyclase (GGDEF)-like protein
MNIETADFPHRQVTVSIGIATISAEIDSHQKLIECADKALFEAKKEGKNQVIVFHGSAAEQQATIH